MTPDTLGPLSRPVPLHTITPAGVTMTVVATAPERDALAADLDLPALHALEGRFRLVGDPDRIRVTGTVTAQLDRLCVVTLEPFTTSLSEEVEVEFKAPDRRRSGREIDVDPDEVPVDELLGDRIDLGTITSEFLALGLDPYPKKPGVAFEPPAEPAASDSPFARLASLRPDETKT
ncbi:DUF177 domain-containing protein [uncultured Enterovirga sp.]|uniref:YceD family protein n=1 Tax=uncultured Enterovirga sp. TaxID=2026352 RepID=UPI0035CB8243